MIGGSSGGGGDEKHVTSTAATTNNNNNNTTSANVEEQTALFEDLLAPEMEEAMETLQQLNFEESEMLKQMRKLLRATSDAQFKNKEFVEALTTELDVRRREKESIMKTFRRVELERTSNTRQLVAEMKRLRTHSKTLENTIQRITNRHDENSGAGDGRGGGGDGDDEEGGQFSVLDCYDWVVDIALLADLGKDGWKVEVCTTSRRVSSLVCLSAAPLLLCD